MRENGEAIYLFQAKGIIDELCNKTEGQLVFRHRKCMCYGSAGVGNLGLRCLEVKASSDGCTNITGSFNVPEA